MSAIKKSKNFHRLRNIVRVMYSYIVLLVVATPKAEV